MARQPLQPAPPPADGLTEPGALSPATCLGQPGAAPALPAASAGPDQALWAQLGWQPSDQQLGQFIALQQLLRDWNQRVNLTRLVEGDDYWIAQVFDSLWPLQPLLAVGTLSAGTLGASTAAAGTAAVATPAVGTQAVGMPAVGTPDAGGAGTAQAAASAGHASLAGADQPPNNKPPNRQPAAPYGEFGSRAAAARPPQGEAFQVIDVGTGGGFPGLAVAIALPEARLTLVDSVKRKLDAVAAMAAELGIADRLTLRCERVERTGRLPECRGRFQLALARAVAAAPVVAEYLVPLLAPDGQALLYRGQWSADDGSALQGALTALGAELGRMERIELPAGRGVRHALSLRPRQRCPAAYPRAVGIPARQPLGQPMPPPQR
jgi:16S rRNA G527 N7-methylase RsmG